MALIGAIVIAGLTTNFVTNIAEDPRISDEVSQQATVAVGGSVNFVATDQVAVALEETDLDDATADAIVDDYEAAQLQALKTGLLAAAAVALLALMFTRNLPSRRPDLEPPPVQDVAAA